MTGNRTITLASLSPIPCRCSICKFDSLPLRHLQVGKKKQWDFQREASRKCQWPRPLSIFSRGGVEDPTFQAKDQLREDIRFRGHQAKDRNARGQGSRTQSPYLNSGRQLSDEIWAHETANFQAFSKITKSHDHGPFLTNQKILFSSTDRTDLRHKGART